MSEDNIEDISCLFDVSTISLVAVDGGYLGLASFKYAPVHALIYAWASRNQDFASWCGALWRLAIDATWDVFSTHSEVRGCGI